ncbi:hypothetical protein STEG23_028517, partial [Scotinomys teguina]
VGGAAVMAVGLWTLVEKSGYLSILASSTFAASAYILIFAGALVMTTGFLGFGAIIREQKSCLSMYFCLLLVIFLVELVAGVLAHVYYQRLSDELKHHLNSTLTEHYGQPRAAAITASVDRLQQDFKCCGSNSSADWQHSTYILSQEAQGRRVPDSCCKTVVVRCGQRAHPSNIYKVEGGCMAKLEQFLADHLLLMGAVGIGVACLQVSGVGDVSLQLTPQTLVLGKVADALHVHAWPYPTKDEAHFWSHSPESFEQLDLSVGSEIVAEGNELEDQAQDCKCLEPKVKADQCCHISGAPEETIEAKESLVEYEFFDVIFIDMYDGH